MRRLVVLLFLFARLALLALAAGAAGAAPETSLDALTSTELRERIAAGTTTVLVPIGGTEQSGPHLALGKHNRRVAVLAARIAERLGHAVVAPVLAYVPEGAISPPTQHMRFTGTISIPEPAFESVLTGTVRSLQQHGLCRVVLLGDHGGYRASLARVAERLNRPPPRPGCGVDALPEYYRAATDDFAAMLKSRGYTAADIGVHAGLADTALTLALVPDAVRSDRLTTAAGAPGVTGNPTRATAELGAWAVQHIIDTSVAALRQRGHSTP